MNRLLVSSILILGSLASLSAAPKQAAPTPLVNVKMVWVESSTDLWEELRQVDPAFKALGAEVARIAKGLDAEEIETRGKAAADLKALGLTAYPFIKEIRNKATSAGTRAELDGVLKAIGAEVEKTLPKVPGARRIGAKESEALRARLGEMRVSRQEPNLTMNDGQPGNIFIGDASPVGHKRRLIQIDGNGASARVEAEGPMVKRGIVIQIVPKVLDPDKGTAALDITATVQGMVGPESTQVTVRVTPQLASKEGFLAGPFPAAEEKGEPWWFLVECQVIKP